MNPQKVTTTAKVHPLTGATMNYSFIVLGYETLGVRRHLCWYGTCLDGTIERRTTVSGAAVRSHRTQSDRVRVTGCASGGELTCLKLDFELNTTEARRTRNQAFEHGERMASNKRTHLVKGMIFACATPPLGYRDALEVFEVADPDDGGEIVRKLEEDTYIGEDKIKKGKLVVWCHDLQRVEEDEDRRIFVKDTRIRFVEARMLRFVGVEFEDCGPAPRPIGALEAAGRRMCISEEMASDIIKACDV